MGNSRRNRKLRAAGHTFGAANATGSGATRGTYAAPELGKPAANQSLTCRCINHYNAPAVYRYFRKRQYAEALASGDVYLSTLESCRTLEDAQARDEQEGVQFYHPGRVTGSSADPHVQSVAAKLGIYLENVRDISIGGNTIREKLEDAFVLCTTERSDSDIRAKFGPYGVKIRQPREFFTRVSWSLGQVQRLEAACLGRVTYHPGTYSGGEKSPGLPGYVKRPVPYGDEDEVRFLWVPPETHRKIKPMTLACPEIRDLCELIA